MAAELGNGGHEGGSPIPSGPLGPGGRSVGEGGNPGIPVLRPEMGRVPGAPQVPVKPQDELSETVEVPSPMKFSPILDAVIERFFPDAEWTRDTRFVHVDSFGVDRRSWGIRDEGWKLVHPKLGFVAAMLGARIVPDLAADTEDGVFVETVLLEKTVEMQHAIAGTVLVGERSRVIELTEPELHRDGESNQRNNNIWLGVHHRGRQPVMRDQAADLGEYEYSSHDLGKHATNDFLFPREAQIELSEAAGHDLVWRLAQSDQGKKRLDDLAKVKLVEGETSFDFGITSQTGIQVIDEFSDLSSYNHLLALLIEDPDVPPAERLAELRQAAADQKKILSLSELFATEFIDELPLYYGRLVNFNFRHRENRNATRDELDAAVEAFYKGVVRVADKLRHVPLDPYEKNATWFLVRHHKETLEDLEPWKAKILEELEHHPTGMVAVITENSLGNAEFSALQTQLVLDGVKPSEAGIEAAMMLLHPDGLPEEEDREERKRLQTLVNSRPFSKRQVEILDEIWEQHPDRIVLLEEGFSVDELPQIAARRAAYNNLPSVTTALLDRNSNVREVLKNRLDVYRTYIKNQHRRDELFSQKNVGALHDPIIVATVGSVGGIHEGAPDALDDLGYNVTSYNSLKADTILSQDPGIIIMAKLSTDPDADIPLEEVMLSALAEENVPEFRPDGTRFTLAERVVEKINYIEELRPQVPMLFRLNDEFAQEQ